MIFFVIFLFTATDAVINWPGTKWCGPGNSAANADDLGSKRNLDACCRDHDHCANVIPPFQRKFGHLNFQFTPLHECECEEKYYREGYYWVKNDRVNQIYGKIIVRQVKI